jgi:hypothetical protein
MSDAIQLLLDSNRGIYIPQHFVNEFDLSLFGIAEDGEDIKTLRAGPDHQWYWEAWDNILQHAETEGGGILHQDGDLWLVHPDKMTNEEYENFFGEMKPTPDGWVDYAACRDCLLYIANNEHNPEDTPEQEKHREDAVARLQPHAVADGAEYGFRHERCEICHALPSDRYRVLVPELQA